MIFSIAWNLHSSEEAKTIFDWCKEGNSDKVNSMLSDNIEAAQQKDEQVLEVFWWFLIDVFLAFWENVDVVKTSSEINFSAYSIWIKSM